jgi:hypothetical protein
MASVSLARGGLQVSWSWNKAVVDGVTELCSVLVCVYPLCNLGNAFHRLSFKLHGSYPRNVSRRGHWCCCGCVGSLHAVPFLML